MVQQPVEQRGRDDGTAEDLAPFGEARVGGEDHGALLIAGVDEQEEQIAAAGHDWQVADLVHDETRGAAEVAYALAQRALLLGLGERGDDVGARREGDAAPSLDGLDGERCREMTLAGAGRSEQMDDLGPVDELQLGQRQDPIAIERGLEVEVEAGKRLDRSEPHHHQRGLDAQVLPDRWFLDEQGVERLNAVDLALFDATEGDVENVECPQHPERHEVFLILSSVVMAG